MKKILILLCKIKIFYLDFLYMGRLGEVIAPP